MSGSVNKCIIVGRLARDVECRTMQSGDKIANMTVVTSEQWRDKASGEKKEKAEFHRVVVFDPNLADIAEKYLSKGKSVYLEGSLQTRKWTDQAGNDKFSTEIVLQRFRGVLTLLGDGDGGGNREEQGRGQGRNERAPQRAAEPQPGMELNDDIPF